MTSLMRYPLTQFNIMPWPSNNATGPVQALLTLHPCHQQVEHVFTRGRLPRAAARKEDVVHFFQRVSLGLVSGAGEVYTCHPVH